jgi:hypothetical protein
MTSVSALHRESHAFWLLFFSTIRETRAMLSAVLQQPRAESPLFTESTRLLASLALENKYCKGVRVLPEEASQHLVLGSIEVLWSLRPQSGVADALNKQKNKQTRQDYEVLVLIACGSPRSSTRVGLELQLARHCHYFHLGFSVPFKSCLSSNQPASTLSLWCSSENALKW